MILKGLICVLSFSFCTLTAHPVIWKNGTVITSKFMESLNEFELHYSLTHQWAVGVHGVEMDGVSYGMVQSNHLLNRWNGKGSQGNMYLFSGLGAAFNKRHLPILHLGVQADWETRWVYTQMSLHGFFKEDPIHFASLRLGVAPYLADFDELNSWIILQLNDRYQEQSHHLSVTPLVRLFKDTFLLEFGSNFSDYYVVTMMIHF